jgi:hypothetical protein
MADLSFTQAIGWALVATLLLNISPIIGTIFITKFNDLKCEQENNLEKQLCQKDKGEKMRASIGITVALILLGSFYLTYIYYMFPTRRIL